MCFCFRTVGDRFLRPASHVRHRIWEDATSQHRRLSDREALVYVSAHQPRRPPGGDLQHRRQRQGHQSTDPRHALLSGSRDSGEGSCFHGGRGNVINSGFQEHPGLGDGHGTACHGATASPGHDQPPRDDARRPVPCELCGRPPDHRLGHVNDDVDLRHVCGRRSG